MYKFLILRNFLTIKIQVSEESSEWHWQAKASGEKRQSQFGGNRQPGNPINQEDEKDSRATSFAVHALTRSSTSQQSNSLEAAQLDSPLDSTNSARAQTQALGDLLLAAGSTQARTISHGRVVAAFVGLVR